jgi:hypothetical protein
VQTVTVTPCWYSGKNPYQVIENVQRIDRDFTHSLGLKCTRIITGARTYYIDERMSVVEVVDDK